MLLFFQLPPPEKTLHGDHALLLAAFLLFRVAGQVSFTTKDLEMLCRDFAGYTVYYESQTDTFVVKLVTRLQAEEAEEYALRT
jgi:hypothetical protein